MALRPVNQAQDARQLRMLRRLLIERWGINEEDTVSALINEAVEDAGGSVQGAIDAELRELASVREHNSRRAKIEKGRKANKKKKKEEMKVLQKISKDYIRKNR